MHPTSQCIDFNQQHKCLCFKHPQQLNMYATTFQNTTLKKKIKQVLQNPKTNLSNLYPQHGHQMANTKFLFLNKFIWIKS